MQPRSDTIKSLPHRIVGDSQAESKGMWALPSLTHFPSNDPSALLCSELLLNSPARK